MEKVKLAAPPSQADVDIKKLIEEKREARKQKLLARLGRNLKHPMSVASLEAITGTLKSKDKPIAPAVIEPAAKSELSKQKEASTQKKKPPPMRRALSFNHTNTSQRRIELANGGPISSYDDKKTVAIPEQKPANTPLPQVKQLQKQSKLTVPYSPKFTNRVRQPVVSKSVTKPLTKPTVNPPKLNMASAKKTIPKPVSMLKETTAKSEVDGRVTDKVERSKCSFMVPLTPEEKARNTTGLSKAINSPRTPKLRPYMRKSFSETKSNSKARPTFARSVSNVSLARSNSSFASRKSMAPSTFSRASRSILPIQKEPSEREKIQQWLDKRGRSVTSCRHLACLGHQLKEFEKNSPANPKSARKSIKIVKKAELAEEHHASPKLNKRQSSMLNTTFEKEEESEEANKESSEEVIVSPPPLFQNEPEPAKHEQPSETKEEGSEERFLTPRDESRDLAFDLSDLQEGRVDKLLETIAALFNEPIYPGAKIQSWLLQSEAAFPVVKTHALYWDIRARLEERRGNHMEALDIYGEAIDKQAEPIDTMKQMFDNFLLRIGASIPTGQRTPLLKSLGVETPMIRRKSLRRPLLDTTQVFQSTTVKYELKLKKIFEDHMKENADVNASTKPLKTPIKFNNNANRLSVACDGAYKLVATPVRRSMRPKATPSASKINEVVYVDDLEELSPNTKAKAVLRRNVALAFD